MHFQRTFGMCVQTLDSSLIGAVTVYTVRPTHCSLILNFNVSLGDVSRSH